MITLKNCDFAEIARGCSAFAEGYSDGQLEVIGRYVEEHLAEEGVLDFNMIDSILLTARGFETEEAVLEEYGAEDLGHIYDKGIDCLEADDGTFVVFAS